jgi:hypothetical protein
MAVERASRVDCVDHYGLRHTDGHLVDVYERPDGTFDLWVNDGPPKTHYLGITVDQLENAILSGQVKGSPV